MACPYTHLTVVGSGLIGGSLVMAARQSYPTLHITVVDSDSATLQALLPIADAVSLKLPEAFDESGRHLIVLASHLEINVSLLTQLAANIQDSPAITVTDIGSCKQAICDLGAALLPAGQFVGGHPLAGKEVSGVQHATGLLFAGKPYVLTPSPGWEADAAIQTRVIALKQFIEEGLRAHVGYQTPEHHDWAMAYVSHLPQLYAVILTNLLANHRPGQLLGFHGAGMDGQLRLAASPYAMWHDIFKQNATNLREAVQGCRELLNEAENQLLAMEKGNALSDVMTNPWFAEQFKTANWIHQEFHAVRRQDAPVVLDDTRSTSAE